MDKNTKLITLWNSIADDYDRFLAEKRDVYQLKINWPELKNLLGDIQGRKVLDAGCANGFYSNEMCEMGAQVVGVDASERLISHAKLRYPDVDFRAMDITEEFHFDDESFDAVLCKMVLMDIENIDDSLHEFNRVLRPHGTCVLSIIHPFYPMYYLLKRTWDGGEPHKYSEVDNYFENKFTWLLTRHSNLKSGIYVRPLSFYINTFVKHQFKITQVNEPEMTSEFANEHPEYKDRAAFPIVINFRLVKD